MSDPSNVPLGKNPPAAGNIARRQNMQVQVNFSFHPCLLLFGMEGKGAYLGLLSTVMEVKNTVLHCVAYRKQPLVWFPKVAYEIS